MSPLKKLGLLWLVGSLGLECCWGRAVVNSTQEPFPEMHAC